MAAGFLLAFAPLIVSIMAWRRNIDTPMLAEEMQGTVAQIQLGLIDCYVLGIVFVFVFAYVEWDHMGEEAHKAIRWLLEVAMEIPLQLPTAEMVIRYLLHPILGYLLRYFLATVAFTDWMMLVSAQQRQFETMKMQAGKLPSKVQKNLDELVTVRKSQLNALMIAY